MNTVETEFQRKMSDEKSESAPCCKRKSSVGNSGRCVKQRALRRVMGRKENVIKI